MTTTLPNVLPSDFVKSLMNGIADSRAGSTTGYSGKPLLRLMKNGEWVFGQENTEVQEGLYRFGNFTYDGALLCLRQDGDGHIVSVQGQTGAVVYVAGRKITVQ